MKSGENRGICSGGEISALGSQQHRSNVARGRLLDGSAQVGEQFTAE
jgi:hypothetical protein